MTRSRQDRAASKVELLEVLIEGDHLQVGEFRECGQVG